MRIFSLFLAAVLAVIVFVFVFERDWLRRGFSDEDVAASLEDKDDPSASLEDLALEGNEGQADFAREAEISVVSVHSHARLVKNLVELRGLSEASRQVDVRAETSGLIISEPLRKGQFIEAGQIICEIDSGTREDDLAEAFAGLREAEAQIPGVAARIEEALITHRTAVGLLDEGYGSEVQLKTAEAALEATLAGEESAGAVLSAATARIARVKEDIARLKIKAPFAGFLESDSAELGSLMQPGSLCATVIQLHPMKLVAFVSEAQMLKIKRSAPARASLISGREIEGKVTFVSRSADPLTRTFRVEVTIDNQDLEISDGQSVEMSISAAGEAAHFIPQQALTLDNEGRLGIRADREGRALFVPVTILRDVIDGVWVTGPAEEEVIIVVGQEYVSDGTLVRSHIREVSQ